jgi:DNA uptake protein ComE-like DNA-binding protein
MRFKSKFQNRVNDRKDRKSLRSLPKIGQQTIKALLKERE